MTPPWICVWQKSSSPLRAFEARVGPWLLETGRASRTMWFWGVRLEQHQSIIRRGLCESKDLGQANAEQALIDLGVRFSKRASVDAKVIFDDVLAQKKTRVLVGHDPYEDGFACLVERDGSPPMHFGPFADPEACESMARRHLEEMTRQLEGGPRFAWCSLVFGGYASGKPRGKPRNHLFDVSGGIGAVPSLCGIPGESQDAHGSLENLCPKCETFGKRLGLHLPSIQASVP